MKDKFGFFSKISNKTNSSNVVAYENFILQKNLNAVFTAAAEQRERKSHIGFLFKEREVLKANIQKI